jgi:hypothetical protein
MQGPDPLGMLDILSNMDRPGDKKEKYIFLPIPTPEMIELSQYWQAGQAQKNKPPYRVLHGGSTLAPINFARQQLGFGVLSKVKIIDKLYVLLHGTSNVPAVGAEIGNHKNHLNQWQGGRWRQLNAPVLAQTLMREGLHPLFHDLRIFACYSGTVTAGSRNGTSFAQELLAAMQGLGYSNLRVAGYKGEIVTQYARRDERDPGRHKGIYIKDQGVFRASAKRQFFS